MANSQPTVRFDPASQKPTSQSLQKPNNKCTYIRVNKYLLFHYHNYLKIHKNIHDEIHRYLIPCQINQGIYYILPMLGGLSK